MNTKMKKIISLILSVVMMCSVVFCLTSCTGETAEENDSQVAAVTENAAAEKTDSIVKLSTPRIGAGSMPATIIIPGISQSNSTYCDANGNPIHDGKGNELSGGLLIIDSSNIVGRLIKKLALPLISSLLTQRVDSDLASGVYDAICDLFSIQKSNIDGTAANNLVVDEFNYPLSQYNEDDKSWFYNRLPMQPVIEEMTETYGVDAEDYTYLFTFPLIGDPMVAADNLDAFIETVKEQTGCSKVNLVAISLGGTVMTAYLEKTMNEGGDFSDINKLIGVVACLDGTDLFADFYARNWNLDDNFLYGTYIPAIMAEEGNDDYLGHLINIALRILPKDVLYTILTAAMDGMLDTLLVNCPQFWSMVPSDRYEELAAKCLSGAEYATLKAKTDSFQQARLDLDENLDYANANYGVQMYNACGYGRQYDTGDYCFLGIAASSLTSNSDSIIDIDSTSNGASYAAAGEKLGVSGAYVSPDGEIDASTCYSPDTTWFFYGQHHEVGRDDVVIKLLAGVLSGKIENVNSDANFPQFNFNRNTRTLTRPDGLMDKAESVIANADGVYTQSQIDAVKPVYEKAQTMLANTFMTATSADEAKQMTTELNDVLASTGLTTVTKTTSFFTKILNTVFTAMDNMVMRTVGGQGFSDKIRSIF